MIEIQAKIKESEDIPFYYYELDYISSIKVRYDNGFSSFPDSQYKNDSILFDILPFVILGLSISIPFLYFKKLSKFDNNKNYELKINTANLLLKIYDSIRNNNTSKKIFDFQFWNEEYSETKRKIFDSYTDYNILNKLYTVLKDRELLCLKENVDDAVLTDSNVNCLKLTTEALNHINWKTLLSDSISKKVIELNYLHHCLFALIIVGFDFGLTLFYITFGGKFVSLLTDWLQLEVGTIVGAIISLVYLVGVVGTIRILFFYKLSSYNLFKDLPLIKKFKSDSKNKKFNLLIIITIAFSSALIILFLGYSLGYYYDFISSKFLSYFCWVLFIEIIRFNVAVYLVTKKIHFMKI